MLLGFERVSSSQTLSNIGKDFSYYFVYNHDVMS